MAFQKVASLQELTPGQATTVRVGGKEIALFNVDGKVFATSNDCAHQGGPLGEGSLEGKVVTCPWHNWKWDVSTGKCSLMPQASIQTYPTKVEGNDIWVEV